MDTTRVIVDSIKAVVNVPLNGSVPESFSCINWECVAIVGIISLAFVIIVWRVCDKICEIRKQKIEDSAKKLIKEDEDIKRTICNIVKNEADFNKFVSKLIKENSEIKIVMFEQIKDVAIFKEAVREVVKEEIKKEPND